MIYQGFFILLYIKVEGNKTALKEMQKNQFRCIPENGKKSADKNENGERKEMLYQWQSLFVWVWAFW